MRLSGCCHCAAGKCLIHLTQGHVHCLQYRNTSHLKSSANHEKTDACSHTAMHADNDNVKKTIGGNTTGMGRPC